MNLNTLEIRLEYPWNTLMGNARVFQGYPNGIPGVDESRSLP